MATTLQDLEHFAIFVRKRLESGDAEMGIDELFDQWRLENPTDELNAENVAAINASIHDFRNGERGTVAGRHSDELRRELGFRKE